MDKIYIENLEFRAYHGVFPEEKNWGKSLSSLWNWSLIPERPPLVITWKKHCITV